MSKELDVVVFGASGYTGKLVVEYLKEEYGDNGDLKWAIAGRSSNKLDAVKEELNLHEDLQSFIVDSDNIESLDSLTQSTKCVLTTVVHINCMGLSWLSLVLKTEQTMWI